jgi:hypothetical protein
LAYLPPEFVGPGHRHDPPLDDIDTSFIDSSTMDEGDVPDDTFQYLTHLDLATDDDQESSINDFTSETLKPEA